MNLEIGNELVRQQPCNPAEDGVCEALECPRADDTALLRQALEALENSRIEYDYHGNPMDECDAVVVKAVDALRERLKP